jgi:acylphosphatase
VVSWCYGGPSHARVEKVEVAWEQPAGKDHGFSILW